MTFETNAASNREVRRVPQGWQHPRDNAGRYEPLFAADHFATSSEEEREEEVASWKGRNLLMPRVEGQAEIIAYETTTEGTPCSPAYPDTPEGKLALVNFCAEHCTTFADFKADAETWAAILFGGSLAWVREDGGVRF